MKKIITLIVLIAVAIMTNGQIPNSGFENWTPVGNCMKPTGWDNTNDFADPGGSYFGVTRSTDHYPAEVGSYSLRIENKTSLLPDYTAMGLTATGFEGPSFPIVGHPTSLCGFYKFTSENEDTMRIFIELFNGGVSVFQETMTSKVTASTWTLFNIPFPTYTVADYGRIFISSYNANGPPPKYVPWGNSVLYIDNLNFDNIITSVPELTIKKMDFNIYPNPVSSELNIELPGNNEVLNFEILNSLQQVLSTGTVCEKTVVQTAGFAKGVYLLKLHTGGTFVVKKIIKE